MKTQLVYIQEQHGQVDLTNHRFGRLVVLCYAHSIQNKGRMRHHWFARCDCGKHKTVLGESLTGGKSLSCGCLHKEIVKKCMAKTMFKHGLSSTRAYKSYKSMMNRCTNINNVSYPYYGGRLTDPVKVCERWLDPVNGFMNFYKDMGECPFPDWSIDRENPTGNYSPENCRWASPETQKQNTRRNYERCNRTH